MSAYVCDFCFMIVHTVSKTLIMVQDQGAILNQFYYNRLIEKI